MEQLKILKQLNTVIGHSDLEKLMIASPSMTEEDHAEINGKFDYEPVLDIKLYIQLEERFRDTDYKEKLYDNFEMEREHIVHKMMFDSLNENLDYRRIYGIIGKPPSFLPGFKKEAPYTAIECKKVLGEAEKEVLEWSIQKNGALMEKEPLLSYMNDLDGLEKIRGKALSDFLNNYISITDKKWKENYEEYLEIFVAISDSVFEHFIEE